MDVCGYRWEREGIKTMSHCVHSVFGPSPIAVKSTIIFMYIIDLHNILFVHVPEYCLLIIRFFFHRSPDSSRHFSHPCLTGPIYCIFFSPSIVLCVNYCVTYYYSIYVCVRWDVHVLFLCAKCFFLVIYLRKNYLPTELDIFSAFY